MAVPSHTRLVGRDDERAQLRAALRQAMDGVGTLALVSGEAGIGKSALVEDLKREAQRRGTLVLAGGCYDLTATAPYGPWIELIDRCPATSELPRPPGPTIGGAEVGGIESQFSLFNQVLQFLSELATTCPLVLILEDIHWADGGSLELLRFAARQLRSLPIMLAASYRDDEPTGRDELDRLIPALVRENDAYRIHLGRLGRGAIEELIESTHQLDEADAGRLVGYIWKRSEGNPLFAGELLFQIESEGMLRATSDGWQLGDLEGLPVPTLLGQVIEGRLRKLRSATREALQIAAVIGQDVPLDLWQKVGGIVNEELDEIVDDALRARLVEEGPAGPELRFRHALFREALYGSLIVSRRRRWHCQVAEALIEARHSEPDIVARHFHEASDPRAVAWHIRASERAVGVFDLQGAIDRLDQAEAIAEKSGCSFPPEGRRLRGRTYEMIGDYEAAFADFAMFLQRAQEDGDLRQQCTALLDLGGLLASRDYQRAGNYFEQALDVARRIGDPAMLAETLNRVGNWLANIERQPESEQRHLEALSIYRELSDRHGVAATYDLLGASSLLGGNMVKSNYYYDRAIPLLRELDDRPLLAQALGGRGHASVGAPTYVLYTDPGRRAAGIAAAEESRAVALDTGWKAIEVYTIAMAAQTLIIRGMYQEALDSSRHALDVAHGIAHDQWICFTRQNLSDIFRDILLPEEAAGLLVPAVDIADRTGSIVWRSWIRSSLALTYVECGEVDRARTVAGRLPELDRPNVSFARLYELFTHASIARAAGELERALDLTSQIIELDPAGRGDEVPKTLNLRGDILIDLERYSEAETTLQTSCELAAARDYQPYHWRAFASLQRLNLARGRMAAAAGVRKSARDIVEALAAELSDLELRTHFITRAVEQLSPEPEGYPDDLTPREIEVLALIAVGRSNRQMAEDLYLSVRTVERHVANIYRKIDAHNRSEATRYALKHSIIERANM